MNVLEKILEEILQYRKDNNLCAGKQVVEIERIIRSHMDEVENDGWIPCSARLPEANERVLVTVKHSRWIADFYSEWTPKEEKIEHPETSGTYTGYINENGIWLFVDEDGQENICDKEFGQDLGKIYDVVTHWQPLPEPYKPKEAPAAGEHIMNRFMKVEQEKMNELEEIVNKMQSDAEMRCNREVEKAKVYCDGYKQGIEDLYAYIRRSKAFKEDSGARS